MQYSFLEFVLLCRHVTQNKNIRHSNHESPFITHDLYMYTRIYIYIHTHMYTRIYIYIHTHVYTHIYTHTLYSYIHINIKTGQLTSWIGGFSLKPHDQKTLKAFTDCRRSQKPEHAVRRPVHSDTTGMRDRWRCTRQHSAARCWHANGRWHRRAPRYENAVLFKVDSTAGQNKPPVNVAPACLLPSGNVQKTNRTRISEHRVGGGFEDA